MFIYQHAYIISLLQQKMLQGQGTKPREIVKKLEQAFLASDKKISDSCK